MSPKQVMFLYVVCMAAVISVSAKPKQQYFSSVSRHELEETAKLLVKPTYEFTLHGKDIRNEAVNDLLNHLEKEVYGLSKRMVESTNGSEVSYEVCCVCNTCHESCSACGQTCCCNGEGGCLCGQCSSEIPFDKFFNKIQKSANAIPIMADTEKRRLRNSVKEFLISMVSGVVSNEFGYKSNVSGQSNEICCVCNTCHESCSACGQTCCCNGEGGCLCGQCSRDASFDKILMTKLTRIIKDFEMDLEQQLHHLDIIVDKIVGRY